MATKLIQVRITEESAFSIASEATKNEKSIKELIESLGKNLTEGSISWDGETFASQEDSEDPKEYYYEPRYDYEDLGIDRLLEILESKNYNLKTVIETMTQSALDAPAYRRKRGMDWGA